MSTTIKPAKLQINARGAWKDVCRFDVANGSATAHIMDSAATIAAYSTDKCSVRIVTDEVYPAPLMYWGSKGWTTWKEHK